ncbi:FadR/GntR family transcriptional regulator [Actinomycetospora sp.]|jgi:DNA-binding FadR family transcriptional regulator|uniref:FadR/GntR family transcriptional regulator n=1 Tax=Actinomycetospora sp. TaxID=1872135 RepID=UPI002F42E792
MRQDEVDGQGPGDLLVGLRDASAPRAFGARTRGEQLAGVLEDRIHDAGLASGAPVGTLDELRAGTGLARATVSEAVRLLAERGVLEVRPGRGGGLFVAERGPAVRMRHTLLEVRDDAAAVADAVELRAHLEELVDVGAARCASAADVEGFRARLAAMASAPDWPGFVRATWALHEALASTSPNAMARAVYLGTLGHLGAAEPRPATTDPDEERRRRADRLAVHTALVDAVAAGDETAVRAAVARHHAV